ncbi:MAG TPA: hypothetical protein VL832_05415 [Puia sp.]|nr:hypothetical protein [Puia sp.]
MTIRELYTRSVICIVTTLRIGRTWRRRSSINCGSPATAITVSDHHQDIADTTEDREGLEENIRHLQKFIAGLKELDKAIVLLYAEIVGIRIVYVLLLALLVYGNHGKNIFFSVSMGTIALITTIAIVVYIKHIVIIKQINYSDSITNTQERLSALQSSTIDIGRILWLQLPFWSTFFWNTEWMMKDIKFWLIAFPVTLVLAGLAIWLYRNISLKNSHRKWFKILFSSREWTSVIKAMEFMKEIEAFKANL